MQLIECFVESKLRDPAICEDMIFEGDHFLAVFDGATDKTDSLYDGLPGGRFAVEALAEALATIAADATALDCVEAISDALRRAVSEHSPVPAPADRPSASAAIYSRTRREIWRIGDCSWGVNEQVQRGSKTIDEIVARARAALLHALLLGGAEVDELLASDPGRMMVLPLLEEQHRFRNFRDSSVDLGFGALDGNPVPERFVEVTRVEADSEVILATDGYPELKGTLADTEEALARDIGADPLRIGRHKATKGVVPGQASFDDRAYLRFRT